MKYILVIVFLVGSFTNCKKKDAFWQDDRLSLEMETYDGNELQIDGFYFRNINDFITVYFLYRNGVLLYGGTFPISEMESYEEDYHTTEWASVVKNHKYNWGIFIVEQNVVKIERWEPSDPPLKAYVEEGVILNDTTILLRERYRLKGERKTNWKELNETFQFRQFSPKPDSANKYLP